eukprot:9481213-Pyramimonas_sp.AAC.1
MREALDSATVDACSQFVGDSTAAWAAKWNANEGLVDMYASACKKELTDADYPKMLTASSTPEAAELYSSYKTIFKMTNTVMDLVGRLAGKPVADLGGGAAAHGPWKSKAVEWIDSLVASQALFSPAVRSSVATLGATAEQVQRATTSLPAGLAAFVEQAVAAAHKAKAAELTGPAPSAKRAKKATAPKKG